MQTHSVVTECLLSSVCSLFIHNLIVPFKPHFISNYDIINLLRFRKTFKHIFYVAGRMQRLVILVFVSFKDNFFCESIGILLGVCMN
jgi:hypothetical protein